MLFCGSANLTSEMGWDLSTDEHFRDLGDMSFGSGNPNEQIQEAIAHVVDQGAKTLVLGGDHSIAYPILLAHRERYPNLTVLQLDAHPDLYDELDGNRFSHACPFARALEAKCMTRLIQIGIRTMNSHQRDQAVRFDVEVFEARKWRIDDLPKIDGPLYISLDLDVLDPAFAPGVSHYEPGGFSTRQVLDILHGIDARVVGADIVELNPTRDLMGTTAMVAAKFVKELGGLLRAE